MIFEEKLGSKIDPKFLPYFEVKNGVLKVNAQGVYYRDLNHILRTLNHEGAKKIEINNVYGQRYLGTDLEGNIKIDIHGVPGNDLGAFMNGPKLEVHGNVQDGCGNTMNEGEIVVHGRAGDITGYSMRGLRRSNRGATECGDVFLLCN